VPSWNDLLEAFQRLADNEKSGWLITRMNEALREVSRLRGDRNVILYGSAFLQKPQAPQAALSITHEDLNGPARRSRSRRTRRRRTTSRSSPAARTAWA